VVIVGAQPLVIVSVLAGPQDHQLAHEGLEHLSRPRIFDSDRSSNEPVWLLLVEKQLQVRKVIVTDSIVRKVQVLEIEVPVKEFAIGISRDQLPIHPGPWLRLARRT